jgi:uncharacterized protein with HEPN domain
MDRDDAIRLHHMLDAAREAIEFATGRSRSELDHNRMLELALLKDIEIVGEAAYQVSARTRTQLAGVPWDDIIGMRHRLVHAYFEVNLDILWRTVESDLPELVKTLESLLSEGTG